LKIPHSAAGHFSQGWVLTTFQTLQGVALLTVVVEILCPLGKEDPLILEAPLPQEKDPLGGLEEAHALDQQPQDLELGVDARL
tara:strand:- start:196 stop:444 length:249 start_codon:yes stop_codon:yes gene_type:complete